MSSETILFIEISMQRIFIISFFLLTSTFLWAQSTKEMPVNSQRNNRLINSAANKLSESLDNNLEEDTIAANYETLAKELQTNKEYAKAEEYLLSAKQIYIKRNDKRKLYAICRELAKVQEAQEKYAEAIANYEEAANLASGENEKQLNLNEAKRLENRWKPEAQSEYIQHNIAILEEKGEVKEQVRAYKQMAETNIQMNQKEEAIANYEKALKVVTKDESEEFSIQKKIANVYISEKEYEKAIDINEMLLQNEDVDIRIEQLKSIAEIHFANNKKNEAYASWTQAYQLALDEGRTIEAKNCVELLTGHYTKEQKLKQSIDLYKDYLAHLELLIQTDSTLIDSKIFQITEQKIAQLEKEKQLKDELIKGKNSFNTVLIVSVIVLVLLLGLIVRSLYNIKNKNRKIALQSLRREMNPHFIFNSLNSVNQYIAQNNELEANKYLTSYSRLMRNIMENSNKDFIKLNKELELLTEYLVLEQSRFKDKFSYYVEVDDSVDTEAVYVPNMLIQPQLENAVWHGLRYKTEKGFLKLSITLQNNRLVIAIEDDGIGLSRSREIKTANQKVHKSRGITNVQERINLLNELYKTDISMEIKEKTLPDTGVIVTLKTGLQNWGEKTETNLKSWER